MWGSEGRGGVVMGEWVRCGVIMGGEGRVGVCGGVRVGWCSNGGSGGKGGVVKYDLQQI